MTPEHHKEAILLAAQEQALRHAEAMEHGPSKAFQSAHDSLVAAVEAALSQAEEWERKAKGFKWLVDQHKADAEAYRVDAESFRALIKFPWFEGEAISRLGVSFLDDDAKSYEQQVRDGIDAARKPA